MLVICNQDIPSTLEDTHHSVSTFCFLKLRHLKQKVILNPQQAMK